MEQNVSRLASSLPLLVAHVDEDASPVRVRLVGELDFATAQDFRRVITGLAPHAGREVHVDLTRLSFCDVRGLRAFVQAHHEVKGGGGHVVLVGASGFLRRLFSLSGLDRTMDIREIP